MFFDEGTLTGGDCNAHNEREAPHKDANEDVEQESNANHPNEETVHVNILFVCLLQLEHLVDQSDAIDGERHKDHLEHISPLDEELVVLREDQGEDVVSDSK